MLQGVMAFLLCAGHWCDDFLCTTLFRNDLRGHEQVIYKHTAHNPHRKSPLTKVLEKLVLIGKAQNLNYVYIF